MRLDEGEGKRIVSPRVTKLKSEGTCGFGRSDRSDVFPARSPAAERCHGRRAVSASHVCRCRRAVASRRRSHLVHARRARRVGRPGGSQWSGLSCRIPGAASRYAGSVALGSSRASRRTPPRDQRRRRDGGSHLCERLAALGRRLSILADHSVGCARAAPRHCRGQADVGLDRPAPRRGDARRAAARGRSVARSDDGTSRRRSPVERRAAIALIWIHDPRALGHGARADARPPVGSGTVCAAGRRARAWRDGVSHRARLFSGAAEDVPATGLAWRTSAGHFRRSCAGEFHSGPVPRDLRAADPCVLRLE